MVKKGNIIIVNEGSDLGRTMNIKKYCDEDLLEIVGPGNCFCVLQTGILATRGCDRRPHITSLDYINKKDWIQRKMWKKSQH